MKWVICQGGMEEILNSSLFSGIQDDNGMQVVVSKKMELGGNSSVVIW